MQQEDIDISIGWGGVSQDTAPGTPGSYENNDFCFPCTFLLSFIVSFIVVFFCCYFVLHKKDH